MERQRLARELHTGVGQGLAAIRLQLEVIAVELPLPPEGVAHALRNIATLTADTMEQAIDRAGLKAGNIGWHAASAAIATVNVLAKIKGE